MSGSTDNVFHRIKRSVIGSARTLDDSSVFHKMSLIAFFAWVGLGADGLSSSCYGPEEAFRALHQYPALGMLIGLASALTVFIISSSYSQIIELFPGGGGGYLVASKLLSPTVGMISGSALTIDYVLTITISVASGMDALFSFLPVEFVPYKLPAVIIGIIGLTVLNMRGIKESVTILTPIFLIFIATHAFAIVYGLFFHDASLSGAFVKTGEQFSLAQQSLGLGGLLFLLVRAYSMGAGTYTGIEAVSNGLPILREPRVKTAKRTMRYMAISLAATVLGLMMLYVLFDVHPTEGKTLNAVVFELMTQHWGTSGKVLIIITLISEATLLIVAAQAGFLDGPRVLANMAVDKWAPTKFAMLSDRLVTQNGILLMGGAALAMAYFTHGNVQMLVVLYSINVFITFSLSQLGMVKHWISQRKTSKVWFRKLFINGIGFILTSSILCFVTVVKFTEGGWITIVVTGVLVALFLGIRNHYFQTSKLLTRLNDLVGSALEVSKEYQQPLTKRVQVYKNERTAVLLVNGFNGLGLHTLFSMLRMYKNTYKNFIFLHIGVVDAGNFKGSAEIELLKESAKSELDKYVRFMMSQGYYAEGRSSIGTDVVSEVEILAPQVLRDFPDAHFFGGQLVFPQQTFTNRWLHNYTAFSIQERLYHLGIPVSILPVRIEA